MNSKKKNKGKKTFLNVRIVTWYHILFWVIVVALFPISLSVWFYRSKKINLSDQAKKITIAVFWGVIAFMILLAVMIPKIKKYSADKEASKKQSIEESQSQSEEASKNEEIRQSLEEAEKSKMTIEFLDMGQADAILISCEDHYMIIDSGDLSVSLSAKILERKIENVDYIVASTGNNESVGGFARALNYMTVQKAFCATTEVDSDKFRDFKSALASKEVELTIPAAGDTYELGSATITFLGPVKGASENQNSSIVLRISHQGSDFLFMGYADSVEEKEIMASGADMNCTLLKVGHHGSSIGTSAEFLNASKPSYAVISVGEGYGHPSDDLLGRLYNAKVKTYRTDMQGDILCTSIGGTLKFTVEENENADTLGRGEFTDVEPTETQSEAPVDPTDNNPVEEDPTENTGTEVAPPETNALGWKYARDRSNNILHRLNCDQLTDPNSIEFYTEDREELFGWGYTPCTICNP